MTEAEVGQPRRSLTSRIVMGMVAGLALGVALNMLRTHGLDPEGMVGRGLQSFLIDGLFYVVGAVFMASLKLLVVPLVFVSLVCGAASLDDLSRLGRIGG
ncbi:dicarboxylate/amino acid:cation symporter, partial [Myxococcota bacterium]|nr:dicarboxylate/amino acid:cation symporter [Myxococcota bacterium]